MSRVLCDGRRLHAGPICTLSCIHVASPNALWSVARCGQEWDTPAHGPARFGHVACLAELAKHAEGRASFAVKDKVREWGEGFEPSMNNERRI